MVTEIVKLARAFYWMPAPLRGHYAREWCRSFRATHSAAERMQVAAAAVVTAKNLHHQDRLMRQNHWQQVISDRPVLRHLESTIGVGWVLRFSGVAAVVFVIVVGVITPPDLFIDLTMYVIPGVVPLMLVVALIIGGDRSYRGYWGMVVAGSGGLASFYLAWFGILGEVLVTGDTVWDYLPVAVIILLVICPGFLIAFALNASHNYRLDEPLQPWQPR